MGASEAVDTAEISAPHYTRTYINIPDGSYGCRCIDAYIYIYVQDERRRVHVGKAYLSCIEQLLKSTKNNDLYQYYDVFYL